MASRRHLRRKACEGKLRFDSLDEAELYAHRANVLHGNYPPIHGYRCPHCGSFHTGHPMGSPHLALHGRRP